jgi:putative transposase
VLLDVLGLTVRDFHRRVKSRMRPMLGFQSFENARAVIAGIEFAEKIKKQQYELRRLGGKDASKAEMCQRVMAA